MRKNFLGLIAVMITGMFVLAACADPEQPTATPVDINPTAAGQPAATATPSDATPAATATPFQADAEQGQILFETSCVSCHSAGTDTKVGPGLGGLVNVAGERVGGQSGDDYIRNSIKNPADFIVPEFQPLMPQLTQLSDNDIEHLLAYINTLQ